MKKRDAKIIALEIVSNEVQNYIDMGAPYQHYHYIDAPKIVEQLLEIKTRLLERADILKNRSIEANAKIVVTS